MTLKYMNTAAHARMATRTHLFTTARLRFRTSPLPLARNRAAGRGRPQVAPIFTSQVAKSKGGAAASGDRFNAR